MIEILARNSQPPVAITSGRHLCRPAARVPVSHQFTICTSTKKDTYYSADYANKGRQNNTQRSLSSYFLSCQTSPKHNCNIYKHFILHIIMYIDDITMDFT